MALVLCLTLLPTAALADWDADITWIDAVSADGSLTTKALSRGGNKVTDSTTTLSTTHIVEQDTIIDGEVTVDCSRGSVSLFLCADMTLTINGTLKINGTGTFFIYGQTSPSGSTGKLIINNSGNGAAIQCDATTYVGSLVIRSGNLEINSTSGSLVKNVTLEPENNYQDADYCTIMKATRTDASGSKELKYTDWAAQTDLEGNSLVIEYCEHDNATYVSASESTHKTHCADCGFVGAAKACGSDGTAGFVSAGKDGHYQECYCGNKFGGLRNHDTATVPTDNGQKHISGCGSCGWTSDGDGEDHKYNADGICEVCHFLPILEGATGNLYDDLKTAIKAGETELTLVSHATGGNAGIVASALEFDFDTDAAITLNMGGCKLAAEGNPALSVSKGNLTVKGDAVIDQTAKYHDLVAPAIEVSGGEVTFEDKVTATGSAADPSAAPAIEVSGGEVTFEGDLTATGGSSENEAASAARRRLRAP